MQFGKNRSTKNQSLHFGLWRNYVSVSHTFSCTMTMWFQLTGGGIQPFSPSIFTSILLLNFAPQVCPSYLISPKVAWMVKFVLIFHNSWKHIKFQFSFLMIVLKYSSHQISPLLGRCSILPILYLCLKNQAVAENVQLNINLCPWNSLSVKNLNYKIYVYQTIINYYRKIVLMH